MAIISLSEVNNFIKNFYDRVGLRNLEAAHASRIREWFVSNMSNIGRYAVRDFERFGSLNTTEGANLDQQKRQDGWQALTEEVPDIDHITYGTGMVYVHGEMEIPSYEDGSGNRIKGDEYGHRNRAPTPVDHFQVSIASAKSTFNETQDGSNVIQGYKWNFGTETPLGNEGNSYFDWEIIMDTVGNPVKLSSWNPNTKTYTASASSTTPATFNDASLYHVDNERNHYPFIIINSAQPGSLNTLLTNLNGDNGMYDGELPSLAKGTYPPKKEGGLTITSDDRVAILDFISPLNETPR